MEDRTRLLIGLAGPISAGKSTFARRLEAAHGFARISFGNAIKEEVGQFLRRPLIAYIQGLWQPWEYPADEAGWDRVIRDLLWENRNEFARALLQAWGMMRRAQHPDYWIQAWLLRARGHPKVVNDNVRMRGEAEAIRGLSGRLVKVFRPDAPKAPPLAAEDPTEHGLDDWADWDVVVANDGSVADLEAKADECVMLLWG